ncbi:predicted protein [Nematostella vectensis]|uniref:G-protein coupled receptors family 1 profile domain-containing protein n=1 Tax=Nematostella vectensis TaxID=45351 RepID=A7RT30_NEMVE|nr:predicted protein [Nematostella vectensis]|eukprot:XP_001637449.1 predicted protein [Nematostella vectensis]
MPGCIVWKAAQILEEEQLCATAAVASKFAAHISVSMINMTAIACDRYFMLYFHLQYRTMVTTTRISVAIVSFWILSFTVVTVGYYNQELAYIVSALSITVCFMVSAVCYCFIYRVVRRQISHHLSFLTTEKANFQGCLQKGAPSKEQREDHEHKTGERTDTCKRIPEREVEVAIEIIQRMQKDSSNGEKANEGIEANGTCDQVCRHNQIPRPNGNNSDAILQRNEICEGWKERT